MYPLGQINVSIKHTSENVLKSKSNCSASYSSADYTPCASLRESHLKSKCSEKKLN